MTKCKLTGTSGATFHFSMEWDGVSEPNFKVHNGRFDTGGKQLYFSDLLDAVAAKISETAALSWRGPPARAHAFGFEPFDYTERS